MSQNNTLLWKKDWLQARISLARLSGRRTPTHEQDLPLASVGAYVGASRRIAIRFFYRQWHRMWGFDRSPH